MGYLLDFPTVNGRIQLVNHQVYLKVSADKALPLHSELLSAKGNRLKRSKSWMGCAKGVIHKMCPPENI